jgi:DNA-binding CsgD family transcriptional regulator
MTRPTKRVTPTESREIERMFGDGFTVPEIARRTGHTKRTIRRHASRVGGATRKERIMFAEQHREWLRSEGYDPDEASISFARLCHSLMYRCARHPDATRADVDVDGCKLCNKRRKKLAAPKVIDTTGDEYCLRHPKIKLSAAGVCKVCRLKGYTRKNVPLKIEDASGEEPKSFVIDTSGEQEEPKSVTVNSEIEDNCDYGEDDE